MFQLTKDKFDHLRFHFGASKILTRLRELLFTHEELRRKVEKMEKKYDSKFKIVFDASAS